MAAQPLTFSRAEIFGLLLQAARGAGLPQGHGEDLANAIAGFGINADLAAAARALQTGWGQPSMEISGKTVIFSKARAVCCLPMALDALQAGMQSARLKAVDEPALITPFLCARDLPVAAREEGASWVLVPGPRAAREASGTLRLDAKTYDVLTRLADLTYVPATDSSRQGAGAGSIDND